MVSFDPDGRERLIEARTTAFGMRPPFFTTAREVTLITDQAESFRSYRLLRFRIDPKVFLLPGSLRDSCTLDPV